MKMSIIVMTRQVVADSGFLFERDRSKQVVGFWGKPKISCGFWGRTHDFHVGFGSGPMLFMHVMKADPRQTGANAPKIHVGPPVPTDLYIYCCHAANQLALQT